MRFSNGRCPRVRFTGSVRRLLEELLARATRAGQQQATLRPGILPGVKD